MVYSVSLKDTYAIKRYDMEDDRMNYEKALGILVAAGRKAKQMDDAMNAMGYGQNPYFDLYGDIADAIYYIVGEEHTRFDESVTYKMLNNKTLTDTACTDMLIRTHEAIVSEAYTSGLLRV